MTLFSKGYGAARHRESCKLLKRANIVRFLPIAGSAVRQIVGI